MVLRMPQFFISASSLSRCLLLSIFFLVSSVVSASDGQTADPHIPLDPSFTVGKLSNGLTYYIKKNQIPKNKVEMRLVVKYGSLDESDQELGAAHFIEHLAFRNSKHFRSNTLIPSLEKLGLRMGGDLNAHTSYEMTQYEISLPSNNTKHLQIGMRALFDFAGGALFLNQDVASEVLIIEEEERLYDTFGQRRFTAMRDHFLSGTIYQRRTPIGDSTIRKTFTAKQLQNLYDRNYRANRMAVIVVGDVDLGEVKKQINRMFSSLRSGSVEPQRPVFAAPTHADSIVSYMTDPQQTDHELQLLLSVRPLAVLQKESTVRQAWLRQMYWSILSNRIRRGSNYISASAKEVNFADKLMLGSLTLKLKGDLENAFVSLNKKLRQLQEKGVHPLELEDIRADTLNEIEQSFKERQKLSSNSHVAKCLNHFVSGKPIWSSETSYDINLRLLKSITLDELNRYAQTVSLDLAKAPIIYYAPKLAEANLPKERELLALASRQSQDKVEEFSSSPRLKSLMKTPPLKPGSIVSESYDARLGAHEWKLSNGVTVILKKTTFSNDRVTMVHTKSGGISGVMDADALAAVYASTLTDSMGFDQLSPRAVQEYLDGKNISYAVNIGLNGRTIYGESGSENVRDLLQLNYQRITNSSRDIGQFQNGLARLKRNVIASSKDVGSVLSDQLRRSIFNNDPRTIYIPRVQDLEVLNIDKVIKLFEELNINFSDSYFVFVGNLDLDLLRDEIPKYLANLPSKLRDSASLRSFPNHIRGVVKRDLYYGTENKASLTLAFLGEGQQMLDLDQLHFSLIIRLLEQRVWSSLREQKNLIYSASISGETYNAEGDFAIYLHFPTAAENLESLEKAIFSEIELLQTKLASEAEVLSIKKALLASQRVAMQTDHYIANQLLAIKQGVATGELYIAPEKLLSKVSSESLRAAAKRFYDTKHFVQIKMRDAKSTQVEQDELDQYRHLIPRDLGYEEMRAMKRELTRLAPELLKIPFPEKQKGIYIDPGLRFEAFARIKMRLPSLEVSACLKKSKEFQSSMVEDLQSALNIVSASSEDGRKAGQPIASDQIESFNTLVIKYLDTGKLLEVEMEKCVDGAPALH